LYGSQYYLLFYRISEINVRINNMDFNIKSKLYAFELTKRCNSQTAEKLAVSLMDAQVDLNPHQIEAALFAEFSFAQSSIICFFEYILYYFHLSLDFNMKSLIQILTKHITFIVR